MHRFQHLVIALNRNASDASLIRSAAIICRLGTVQRVQFVHVLPQSGKGESALAHATVLDELESAVTSHFFDVPSHIATSSDVLSGPLLDRLLTHVAEHHVDLILIGQECEAANRRSLARRLAMKAPCSVLMIPEGSAATFQRILVPIDFSKHSEDSLRVVVSIARANGATCIPLHVYFNEAVATYEEYDQVLRGEEKAAYQKFVAAIDCRGVELLPQFEEGANVPHVIDRVAKKLGADLIVMGTRGRSRSASILLGSVTDEMLAQTALPLLVVKHFGAQMGVLEVLLDRRFLHRGGLHTD